MQRPSLIRVAALVFAAGTAACGGGGEPTDVRYGETTILAVLNPTVNDANDAQVRLPGTERSGVLIASDDGRDDTTDSGGIAILAGLDPGNRTLVLSGGEIDSSLSLEIDDGDLREVAISADADGAATMSVVVWVFGNDVVEVVPEMSNTEVNEALSASGSVVFFAGGTYTGDLEFSGSNVTLFGAGPRGGRVVIDGNVTVPGSGNRIRGAIITGNLNIPGSDAGVSFSRVDGQLEMSGSSGVLLYNDLCGAITIAGSNVTALDNTGMAPLAPLDDC
ncbi:MAG TPA: hypothetical protein VML75_23495 [Kofleriaceae bacterium]|nr:hypothetical protein [Kofleriaceae bacterium]